MLYDTIAKLNLKDITNTDYDKTYDLYLNGLHIIELYLVLSRMPCPRCGSLSNKPINRKLQKIKDSTSLEPNILINFHKRIFKCNDCFHYFGENNPIILENRSISLNTDLEYLMVLLKELTETLK